MSNIYDNIIGYCVLSRYFIIVLAFYNILEYGLLSRQDLEDYGIQSDFNDSLRIDDQENAICVRSGGRITNCFIGSGETTQMLNGLLLFILQFYGKKIVLFVFLMQRVTRLLVFQLPKERDWQHLKNCLKISTESQQEQNLGYQIAAQLILKLKYLFLK